MIQSLISSAYLLQIFHCPWRPAKPRTGMSFFKQFSNNFPTKLSVSQSMSLHDLYGCRNLFGENHFDFLSPLVITYFLSGLTEVFFARKMHSTSEFAMMVLSKCEEGREDGGRRKRKRKKAERKQH